MAPAEEAAAVRAAASSLGLPGIVDVHTHFMPSNVLEKVWAYSFVVTNLDVSTPKRAREVEAWYRRRTDIEDRIRDAKHGAALRHLPSGNRAVNTAWMWGALLAVNLSAWLHVLAGLDHGQLEGRTHRNAQHAPRKRVGTAGPQEDRPAAKRRARPNDAPQVGRILHVGTNHHRDAAGHQRRHGDLAIRIRRHDAGEAERHLGCTARDRCDDDPGASDRLGADRDRHVRQRRAGLDGRWSG